MDVYTVKQLALLSGVSVRTLHHYDGIGLLAPAYVGDNGYRYYERAQVLRLQQILFYRQLDMALADIAKTLDATDFDLAEALQMHRRRLLAEQKRFSQLLLTIDETLKDLNGEKKMENPFKGFSAEQQAAHEKELLENSNEETRAHINEETRAHIKESLTKVKNMSEHQHDAIKEDGHQINLELVKCLEDDLAASEEHVQTLIGRHHAWVSNYWVPNKDAYIGLGQNYCNSPEFRAFYDKYDERLVEFLAEGMKVYAEANLV